MKKHDKKRIKGIKEQQKIAKAKKHVRALNIECAIKLQTDPMPPQSNDLLVAIAQNLSMKDLKVLMAHSDKFKTFGGDELCRIAKDEFALRKLELSK